MENSFPLISVVIPAYNCESFISNAIKSVLQQTYTNLEILIADDGSIDKTRMIIDSFEDKRIIKSHNKFNEGNIRTRNRLFNESSGDYITIVDADDWIALDKIEKQFEEFKKDFSLGASLTNWEEINIDNTKAAVSKIENNFHLAKAHFNDDFKFVPASVMIRKNVYHEIGGLNLYFDRLFAEDRYWIYLIMERYPVLFMKEPLYFYRANTFSLTNKIDLTRKITITTLVNELIRQRQMSNSDWLSQGHEIKALEYERNLLSDKIWLSEKYRIFAARSIDLKNFRQGIYFLSKSLLIKPFKIKTLKTLFYAIRTFVKSKYEHY